MGKKVVCAHIVGTDLKTDMVSGLSYNVGETTFLLLLSLGVHILAFAADQLQTARRAAFAIAAPMVVVTHQGAAITASGVFRSIFKEISLTANGDTLVDPSGNMDLGYAAAFAFQHVPAAQFTFRSLAHSSTSIISELL